MISYGRWLGRYGSAITQWANVESSMAFHYNMTLDDIWTMSWRRFVILFDALWPRKDEDSEELRDDGTKKFNVIDDWNKAVGSQPTSSKPVELIDYMKRHGSGPRYN
jgi:hypothetical protein